MKHATHSLLAAALLCFATSCDNSGQTDNNQQNMQTDMTLSDTATGTEGNSAQARMPGSLPVLTGNLGRYPREANVLSDPTFVQRIKSLTKTDYDRIVQNFNDETPIIQEDSIYKFTACKQNACADFQTVVLYDAVKDNLNVQITRNGHEKIYNEKGQINYTESLRNS